MLPASLAVLFPWVLLLTYHSYLMMFVCLACLGCFPLIWNQAPLFLPSCMSISYKILLLTYKALNDLAPAYLTSLQSRYNPPGS